MDEKITPLLLGFYTQLIGLIPAFCPSVEKTDDGDFTRNRKLPLQRLIVLVLHLVGGGQHPNGVDIRLGDFFNLSRRGGLWPGAQAPHRSAVSKARAKLAWGAFEGLFRKAVELAYRVFPPRDEYTWCGLSVIAFDGSKYTLPATPEVREAFDPDSGLDNPGKGHYPQALVNTAYDVFRRMPVARSVRPIKDGNEREEAGKLLGQLPPDCVCLFDRGYPSHAFIRELSQQGLLFVMRCPAKSTFPAVHTFVQSGQKEGVIHLMPGGDFQRRPDKQGDGAHPAIKLRIIRLDHPDGTVSVLLTNLFDRQRFTCAQVVDLYYRRWAVENHYRDEKKASISNGSTAGRSTG